MPLNTYPSRIMIPLTQDLAQALAEKTDALAAEDPRLVVANILRQKLTEDGFLRELPLQVAEG